MLVVLVIPAVLMIGTLLLERLERKVFMTPDRNGSTTVGSPR